MDELLDRYGALLEEVDDWFGSCLELHPDQIACHHGCSACCRGLFDITLLDALFLKRGFDTLPESQKSALIMLAAERMNALTSENPAFTTPWLLNSIPEQQWDPLMPEEDETPCLLLSPSGGCLLYRHRPMTCRLNGIPLIDSSGEDLFDEWCTLNFSGKDPRTLTDIRFAFTDLFARELQLFWEMMFQLNGTIRNEVDLFIPAALLIERDTLLRALLELPEED